MIHIVVNDCTPYLSDLYHPICLADITIEHCNELEKLLAALRQIYPDGSTQIVVSESKSVCVKNIVIGGIGPDTSNEWKVTYNEG